ncbi:hypothetical protein ACQ4LE_008695 [Meloidogyne hapla]
MSSSDEGSVKLPDIDVVEESGDEARDEDFYNKETDMGSRRGKSSSSTSISTLMPKKQYIVEAIVNKRVSADGHVEYYLKWFGHPESENSWEPEENLHCPELIEKFTKFQKRMEAATPMGPVEEIIGAARMNNEIFYLVQYAGSENAEFIPSRIAKKRYPMMVVDFFEKRYTEDR